MDACDRGWTGTRAFEKMKYLFGYYALNMRACQRKNEWRAAAASVRRLRGGFAMAFHLGCVW